MPTYLIGFDLHKGENYKELDEAIIHLSGGTYWHHLDTTWLIHHSGPAAAIRNALLSHLVRPNEAGTAQQRRGDKLLVVELTGQGAWTLAFGQRASEWLKDCL